MMDEKIKELINRDLDGLLSDEERRRLEEYLQNNEEARRYFEQMQKMNDWLNQVPPVEAPSSLKAKIMNQLDTRRYAPKSGHTKFYLGSVFGKWFKGGAVRPAYAFATGVVLSGLIFLIILWQTTNFQQYENLPVTGTMKVETQTIPIALPAVTGKLEFTSGTALSKLNVILKPQEKVSLTIEYDPKALILKAIEPRAVGFYELRQKAGKIVINTQQKLSIDFNFQHLKPSAQFSTSLDVGGKVVFRKKIIF